MNVLLGGDGTIGRALARQLAARDEPIVSFDLASGFDLSEREPPHFGPDAFYWFLAWDVGGAKYLEDPAAQAQIVARNVALCERVFGWLEARRAKFLFTSSQLAGRPDAYGATKAMGERLARERRGQIAVLWNVYDAQPVGIRSHVISDLASQALGGTIRLRTQGTECRRFLHADDCARALILQRDLDRPLAHIAGPEWVRIIDVARLLASATGATVHPGPLQGSEWRAEPTMRVPGWAPEIDLPTGLNDVLRKLRAEPFRSV